VGSMTGRNAMRGELKCPGRTDDGLQGAPAGTGRNRFRTLAALGRLSLVATLMGATLGPAAADFRVCNKTGSRAYVAVGYKDAAEGWTTTGWWTISAHSCKTVGHGWLDRRYYFIYAVNDDDIEWSGESFMCTLEEEFTIHGFNDCRARGYDKKGFREIDTGGNNRSWTEDLNPPSSR
jgi:uncharacterized membrane protein